MLFSNPFKNRLPSDAEALPGRDVAIWDGAPHCVLGTPTMGPFPDHLKTVQLGLGCFWGAERLFWKIKGVYSTAVGYAGGPTPNPSKPGTRGHHTFPKKPLAAARCCDVSRHEGSCSSWTRGRQGRFARAEGSN